MAVRDLIYSLGIGTGKFVEGYKVAFTGLESHSKSTTNKAKADFEGFAATAKKALGGIGVGGIALGTALGNGITEALSRALDGLKDLLKDSIGAAMNEAEGVNKGLDTALHAQGTTFEANKGIIEKYGETVRDAFNIDPAQFKTGLTELLHGGLSLNESLKQTALVADIAKAKQISYADASAILVKAANGEVRGLKELGIFIAETGDKTKDSAAAMAKLQQEFSGAAGRANNNNWEAVKVTFDEITKSIGQQLLPIITPLITRFAQFIRGFSNTAAHEWIETLGARIKGFGTTAFGILSSVWNFITQLPKMLVTAFQSGALLDWVGSLLGTIVNVIFKYASVLFMNIGTEIKALVFHGIPALALSVGSIMIGVLKKIPGLSKALSYAGINLDDNAKILSGLQNEQYAETGKGLKEYATNMASDLQAAIAPDLQAFGKETTKLFTPTAAATGSNVFGKYADAFNKYADAGAQQQTEGAAALYGDSALAGPTARAYQKDAKRDAAAQAKLERENAKLERDANGKSKPMQIQIALHSRSNFSGARI